MTTPDAAAGRTAPDLDTHAEQLRHDMAASLADAGAIRSAAWRVAFEQVPRHRFTPRFSYRDLDGQVRELSQDAGREWLSVVYTDASLITQYDNDGAASSSSSQPSVMATMLEALDVGDHDRVLEIGTGTGYNAALVCQRLADTQLTSIDIDPDLIDLARARLGAMSLHPTLIAGDGMAGAPDHAPFDKIIATCGTPRIPPALLTQLRPGGRLVTNIGRALVALDRTDTGASGPLLPMSAAFMFARHDTSQAAPPAADDVRPTAPRVTDLPSDALVSGEFAVLASLIAPSARHLWTIDTHTITDAATGSQATYNRDARTVAEHGSRKLWAELEALYHIWDTAGRPKHDHLGLTIDQRGQHQLWQGQPASILTPLPSAGWQRA